MRYQNLTWLRQHNLPIFKIIFYESKVLRMKELYFKLQLIFMYKIIPFVIAALIAISLKTTPLYRLFIYILLHVLAISSLLNPILFNDWISLRTASDDDVTPTPTPTPTRTPTRFVVQFAVVCTSELKANSRRRSCSVPKKERPRSRRCRAVIEYLWPEIEAGIV